MSSTVDTVRSSMIFCQSWLFLTEIPRRVTMTDYFAEEVHLREVAKRRLVWHHAAASSDGLRQGPRLVTVNENQIGWYLIKLRKCLPIFQILSCRLPPMISITSDRLWPAKCLDLVNIQFLTGQINNLLLSKTVMPRTLSNGYGKLCRWTIALSVYPKNLVSTR